MSKISGVFKLQSHGNIKGEHFIQIMDIEIVKYISLKCIFRLLDNTVDYSVRECTDISDMFPGISLLFFLAISMTSLQMN